MLVKGRTVESYGKEKGFYEGRIFVWNTLITASTITPFGYIVGLVDYRWGLLFGGLSILVGLITARKRMLMLPRIGR